MAIKTIKHKGLSEFFFDGRTGKVQKSLVKRLTERLIVLHEMKQIAELDALPAYRLHQLKGKAQIRFSIWVNGNMRLTFIWDGENVHLLDLEDYH